ncbi:MAG: transposase [Candidatus Eisenbacteria bacterium]
MAKRSKKSYTEKQRQEILEAAAKDDLTADQVHKRFGVKPVTYYSWRKKKGIVGKRGRRPKVVGSAPTAAGRTTGSDLSAQVRAGVQAKVREILPAIVREEVASYLNALFGTPLRRGPGRPRKQI